MGNVVLGVDGAPFGKDSTACSCLVSFLNRGKNILSNTENFMIFGANCKENSIVIIHYVKFLLKEIIIILFSEFPNDLNMMAFLAGELSVSTKYFSTFANVNTDNCDEPNGTFGSQIGCTWQPWSYSKRVSVFEKVVKLKKKCKNVLPKQREIK